MYLQRRDLELQRESLKVQQEELKNNTEELRAQRTEFETQNKTMKLQRFENTCFNMLSLQQEIVNGIKTQRQDRISKLNTLMMQKKVKTTPISGREVFEYIYDSVLQPTIVEFGIKAFKEISDLRLFDHYFRHLYRIVKFVDETTLLNTKSERYSYISMLRATLSRYELVLLFYNGLLYPHFQGLIQEYSFLNNLNLNSLMQTHDKIPEDIKKYYEDSAYDPSIKGYNKSLES